MIEYIHLQFYITFVNQRLPGKLWLFIEIKLGNSWDTSRFIKKRKLYIVLAGSGKWNLQKMEGGWAGGGREGV